MSSWRPVCLQQGVMCVQQGQTPDNLVLQVTRTGEGDDGGCWAVEGLLVMLGEGCNRCLDRWQASMSCTRAAHLVHTGLIRDIDAGGAFHVGQASIGPAAAMTTRHGTDASAFIVVSTWLLYLVEIQDFMSLSLNHYTHEILS
jgi:hypothetical protein